MPKLPGLKSLRQRRFLSQDELAKLAKVTRGTVARIEAGEDCQPKTARALADALGVEPGALLEEAGKIKAAA